MNPEFDGFLALMAPPTGYSTAAGGASKLTCVHLSASRSHTAMHELAFILSSIITKKIAGQYNRAHTVIQKDSSTVAVPACRCCMLLFAADTAAPLLQ
jgi:hypothetical protein